MGSSEGTEQQADIGRASAELQQLFASFALPALQQTSRAHLLDLGAPGSIPASVRAAYGQARERTNADFEHAESAGRATVNQAALQSGMAYNPSALSDSGDALAMELNRARAQRMQALRFQEAQAGQNQTNYLLSQLTQTSGNLMQGSLGFGQNAFQAGGLLNQMSQQQGQQGSLYGSIVGGVLGSILSPGAGTAVGSAAGGAVGGWLGGR